MIGIRRRLPLVCALVAVVCIAPTAPVRAAPPPAVALATLPPASAANGYGPHELNRSNGGPASNDGGPISIAGTTYARGLGVHAPSLLVYDLGGAYSRFQATVGVDDVIDDEGSVEFSVYADGRRVFTSGVRRGSDAAMSVDVSVAGARTLHLLVTGADDGFDHDHADWGDARLVRSQVAPPTTPPTVAPAPVATTPPPGPTGAANNAADRMIIWARCDEVAAMSDADLRRWRNLGADGFVCMTQHLFGMGGTQNFTGDPSVPLAGDAFRLQRALRDGRVVARARALGMRMYLGAYLVNFENPVTPLAPWFDDQAWTRTALPALANLAGAARSLGFVGLAFDEELYRQRAGQRATWSVGYPGAPAPRDVRAKVRERGAQMMLTILSQFPNVEIADYGLFLPENWEELVQQEINRIPDARARSVQIDLWDGLTSVEGYTAIRFYNAAFYKTTHLRGSTWSSALQYDQVRTYALLSRRLSNWDYAASRVHNTPFAWVGPGTTTFEAARPVSEVRAQLDAFRRWGTGGEFANYVYGSLGRFDHSPYAEAMSSASTPGPVDTTAPSISITSVVRNGTNVFVRGVASDDMAVRSVRWQVGTRGDAVPMTAALVAGDAVRGGQWQVTFEATVPAPPGSTVLLRVDDIKGLTASTARVV